MTTNYNGDGEEVAELKWRTTKEPKTKRTTMTTKATNTVAAGVATMFCSTTAVSRKVKRVMQCEFRG